MALKLLPLIYKTTGHVVYLITGFSVVATIDFQDKITLGSILTTAVLISVAGLFTVRSKIANIWREEAEGERAAKERCLHEISELKAERAAFERDQQEIRHDLKDQLAAARAQIKVLESKTDLTEALGAIKDIGEHGTAVSRELVETIGSWNEQSIVRDERTHVLLEEIRDKLPAEPITVREITSE